MTDDIQLTHEEQVATITLSRADKRNALTLDMLRALEATATQVSDDDATRVVVIRAEGKHFSVGADLDLLDGASADSLLTRRRIAEAGGRMLRAIREIRQPTIAAIHGIATGGGACIATACDFRIATHDARLGYGEINMAMNLMWHALPQCVQLVGPARAKRMIMSGELFAAETLAQWGFVDATVESENLGTVVARWSDHYAALPPVAAQMIKRSINQYAGALDQAIMHADSDQWLLATQSDDFREAVTAFMEKRPPFFTGD